MKYKGRPVRRGIVSTGLVGSHICAFLHAAPLRSTDAADAAPHFISGFHGCRMDSLQQQQQHLLSALPPETTRPSGHGGRDGGV